MRANDDHNDFHSIDTDSMVALFSLVGSLEYQYSEEYVNPTYK